MIANTSQKSLAAVLFLTLFLTGCGGSSESEGSDPSVDGLNGSKSDEKVS